MAGMEAVSRTGGYALDIAGVNSDGPPPDVLG